MSRDKVILITGANRGLGLGLAKHYLKDPSTKLILTTRSGSPDEVMAALQPQNMPGSIVGIYGLDSTSDTDARDLHATLVHEAIDGIDVIIANAGVGTKFQPVLEAPVEDLRLFYEANTLGPVKLIQALWPLLASSPSPKFVVITSVLGSTDMMDNSPCGGYGASKAAANYFVKKLHIENPNLVAVALHPGWVKTASGQAYADAVSFAEPPTTVEDSVRGMVEQIDKASRDTTSGKFIDAMTGNEYSW